MTISGNYIEGYFGGLTVKGQYATSNWAPAARRSPAS